jgi:hypothetical protein
MKHFPGIISRLPAYEGRFDAVQLTARLEQEIAQNEFRLETEVQGH